jgi:hypothetical protein
LLSAEGKKEFATGEQGKKNSLPGWCQWYRSSWTGWRRWRTRCTRRRNDLDLTGGNSESVPDRKGKRKITEENITEEAKKVKLMALTSEPPASTSGPFPFSAASPSPSTSGRAPGRIQSQSQSQIQEGNKKKSLLGLLLTGGKVDAGRGFGLFD